jgi:type I restriction enzyme R subunit
MFCGILFAAHRMHELEWQTRKKRSDSKLTALDPPWTIVKYKEGMDISVLGCHAVEEFPTASGPADHSLVVGGRLVGFIEAKKVAVAPQNVLEQAKRYARTTDHGIGNWEGFKVLFIYASKGEVIWFADVGAGIYTARRISQFHTADALREKLLTDHSAAHRCLLITRRM